MLCQGHPATWIQEEEEVVRWITGCAEIGCAKSASEVMAVVSNVVREKKGSDCQLWVVGKVSKVAP